MLGIFNEEISEQIVLGHIMADHSLATDIFGMLSPEDFADPRNREIYSVCVKLDTLGIKPDTISVYDHLVKSDRLDSVGGAEYLAQLGVDIPLHNEAIRYAKQVKERSMRSQLASAADVIKAEANASDESIEEILGRAESRILAINDSASSSDFVPLSTLVKGALDDMDSALKGGVFHGVHTGIGSLDRLTTGFHGGELIIIAARPSVGKTALSINMAQHMASRGIPVAFFSLEMTGNELASRMLSATAGISMRSVMYGMTGNRHVEEMREAALKLDIPMHVDDCGSMSVLELRSLVRRFARRVKLGAVFVDYLQLMSGAKGETREREVASVTSNLKALAKELHIPIVAVSQLNRRVVDREGPPRLSDLRESGAIEQDADVVLFLYDPEFDSPERDSERRKVRLIIGKQRNGPLGFVELLFLASETRFVECCEGEEGDYGYDDHS